MPEMNEAEHVAQEYKGHGLDHPMITTSGKQLEAKASYEHNLFERSSW